MKKLLLLAVLALAGCPKDPPPTGPVNNGGGDDKPAVDPKYACEVDTDCVAVELECCDACNGGEAVGVHKDHVDEVVAESPAGQNGCENTMCTMMGCAPWEATCQDGTCEIQRGEL